jgi:hypothetical protein
VIPRDDVEIKWKVDYQELHTPSAQDLEYGGFATRQYSIALVLQATWELASEWLARERGIVARIASQAADAHEFDLLARKEEEDVTIADPNEGFVGAPDLGMFAACLALCAGGCATAASCRGHPDEHAWSNYPIILLTADRDRARLVEDLARQSGSGLASTGDGRLELWAPSVAEMLQLAELVIGQRKEFDRLPRPRAFGESFAYEDAGESTWPDPDQQSLFWPSLNFAESRKPFTLSASD